MLVAVIRNYGHHIGEHILKGEKDELEVCSYTHTLLQSNSCIGPLWWNIITVIQSALQKTFSELQAVSSQIVFPQHNASA